MKTFKKVLKWTGIVLGSSIGLLLVAYTVVYFQTESRFAKVYNNKPGTIAIPRDSATLARGKHLTRIKGCRDCHGADLAGKAFLDDSAVGRLVAGNLTKGKGGLPQHYADKEWILALRHGVGPNGKGLLAMPSHETTKMSDADLAAVIAYCQSLQPIDRELPDHYVAPMARILMVAGVFPMLSAEKIDHQATHQAEVEAMVSPEYGAYLAVSCSGCHGENFQGGPSPVPGFPPIPNITSAGHPGKWTEEEFIKTLRTGLTPEGKQMKNTDMPWQMTSQYTDLELKALRTYLMTLPGKEIIANK